MIEDTALDFSTYPIKESVEKLSEMEKLSEERTNLLDQMLEIHKKIDLALSGENSSNTDVTGLEKEIEALRERFDFTQGA